MKLTIIWIMLLVNISCFRNVNKVIEIKFKEINSDLIEAIKRKDIEKVKKLLENGSNFKCVNDYQNILEIALNQSSNQILKLLLDNFADFVISDINEKVGYMPDAIKLLEQYIKLKRENKNLENVKEQIKLLFNEFQVTNILDFHKYNIKADDPKYFNLLNFKTNSFFYNDILKKSIYKYSNKVDRVAYLQFMRVPLSHRFLTYLNSLDYRFYKLEGVGDELYNKFYEDLKDIFILKYFKIFYEIFGKEVIFEDDTFGENLLHKACSQSNLELVEFLTEIKMDNSKKDKRIGFTPIFFSIKEGNLKIVEYLLDNIEKLGINIFETDLDGRTLLHHAAISLNSLKNDNSKENKKILRINFMIIIRYLIEKAFQSGNLIEMLEKKDFYSKTFYNYFDYKNRNGEKRNFSFEKFLTYYSCYYFTNEILDLIFKGISIEFEDENEVKIGSYKINCYELISFDNLLLFEYIFRDNINKLMSFLDGWLQSIFDSNTRIPSKILAFLLKYNKKDISEFSRISFEENFTHPLSISISQDNYKAFEVILAKTTDVNYLDTYKGEYTDENLGTTALSKIIKDGRVNMFNLILQREGLDINRQDWIGCTATHYAAEFGRDEMLKELIARGANLEIENKAKEGPLAIAVKKGNKDILKILLRNSALDSNIEIYEKLASNISELDIFYFCNQKRLTYYERCARRIESLNDAIYEEEAKINEEQEKQAEEEYEKQNNLYYFMKNGDIESFKKNFNVENINNYYSFGFSHNQETFLHLAIKLKKENFVSFLLENGSNPLNPQKDFFSFPGSRKAIKISKSDCIYQAIEINDLNILEILLNHLGKDQISKSMWLEYLKNSLELQRKEAFKKIADLLNFSYKKILLEELLLIYIDKFDKQNIFFILSNFYEKLEIEKKVLKYIEKVINNFKNSNLEINVKEILLEITKLFLEYKVPNIDDNLILEIINTNYIPFIKIFFNEIFQIISKEGSYEYLNLEEETLSYLQNSLDIKLNINKLFEYACKYNNLKTIKTLKNQINIIYENFDSNDNCIEKSHLFNIINLKDENLKLELLEHFYSIGADLNKKDSDSNNLIHSLCMLNFESVKSMEYLLSKFSDINQKNNKGETALHLAVKHGKKDRVKLLLEKDIDKEIKNSEGKTALIISILDNKERVGINGSKRYDIIDQLLIKGSDVNVKYGIGGNNTLMLAIIQNDVHLASKILYMSIDVNAQNFRGETALMLVIKDLKINLENKLKIIKRFLEKEKIKLDIRDKKGNDVFKLAQDLEVSKFKTELINLFELYYNKFKQQKRVLI